MSQVSGFLGEHVGFVVFTSILIVLVVVSNSQRRFRPADIASGVLGGAFLSVILYALWNIGTTQSILATFLKSDFIQAIAALATASATVALWIVTGRLRRVTSVQVHATTAPLILSLAYLRNDPEQNAEVVNNFFLPLYTFEAEDAAVPDINSFHREHDALLSDFTATHDAWTAQQEPKPPDAPRTVGDLAPPTDEPTPPPKQFLVIRVFNGQAASSYGLATDLEIDVVWTLPRYSLIKGWTAATQVTPAEMIEQPRTLRVPLLAGQGSYAITAFRVDQVPFWTFRIEGIRHKNYRGKPGTYAVGTKSGTYGPAGFSVETGSWPAMKDEQPN